MAKILSGKDLGRPNHHSHGNNSHKDLGRRSNKARLINSLSLITGERNNSDPRILTPISSRLVRNTAKGLKTGRTKSLLRLCAESKLLPNNIQTCHTWQIWLYLRIQLKESCTCKQN